VPRDNYEVKLGDPEVVIIISVRNQLARKTSKSALIVLTLLKNLLTNDAEPEPRRY
jgi:hypothetical protein